MLSTFFCDTNSGRLLDRSRAISTASDERRLSCADQPRCGRATPNRDYAVTTSIEATGSASNASRAPAFARTMASICAVDWLPTRSHTIFGGLP